MTHTAGTQISILVPDILRLGDDDMSAIARDRDGRWSDLTKRLLVEFRTQKLDLNRGWAATWTGWSCPCCKRNKHQIVRLTSGEVLLCHLELHHDHLDDYVKRIFREIKLSSEDPDLRVQASRAEGALRSLVERFERTLICVDCNLADARAKSELREEIELHFTFTPSEIAQFIEVQDNQIHEIDIARARRIWTNAREDFKDRIDFARRMAMRIEKGRHRREVAPGQRLNGQPQTRDICFQLCAEQLPDIYRLHLGEAIEARSVARDGVGATKKPSRKQKGQPPTDAEFASLDADQRSKNKPWRDAGEGWKCPCCERSKRDICRRSNRGKWTAKIQRFDGFELETRKEQLWRRRLDGAGDIVISAPKPEWVCHDCRGIVTQLRQRRPDLETRVLTLENLRELAALPAANVAHEVDFTRAEEMIIEKSAFLDAITEFEEHQRQITDARGEYLNWKKAGCSDAGARDFVGYRLAKERDWDLEEGDAHADWLLEEAARLSTVKGRKVSL